MMFWIFCVKYISKFNFTCFSLLFIVWLLENVKCHRWPPLCYCGTVLLSAPHTQDTLIYGKCCQNQASLVSLLGLCYTKLAFFAPLLDGHGRKRPQHSQSPAYTGSDWNGS